VKTDREIETKKQTEFLSQRRGEAVSGEYKGEQESKQKRLRRRNKAEVSPKESTTGDEIKFPNLRRGEELSNHSGQIPPY